MENQAQQNQPQPKQKQNNLNVKKILKLVFLGNGKYWPTTVFFWMSVISLFILFLENHGFGYFLRIFGIIYFLWIFGIIYFLLSLPFHLQSLSFILEKINLLGKVDCNGFCFLEPYIFYLILIVWSLIILIINYLCITLIKYIYNKTRLSK